METEATARTSASGREQDAQHIAAAAHAWLDRYNGRAVRLHRAHIFEITRILLRAGVQPTVEAIRQVNGGVGSPNVIHPELKAYFREKELLPGGTVAARPAEDMPEELFDLWRVLKGQARSSLAKDFEQREAELEVGRARLTAAEADLLERTRLLEERDMGREQLIAQLHTDIQMARAEARDARDASAERLRVLKLAQDDVERLRNEAERLRADLVGRTEQTAEARGALAVANTQLAAASSQLEQQARLVAAADERATQARNEHTAALQRGDRLAVEHAAAMIRIGDLEKQAAVSEERATHATEAARVAGAQLEALQSELSTLQAAHATTVRDAQQLANTFAQLRGAQKELDAVRLHLEQMRTDRDAATRDRDQLLRNPPGMVQRLAEIEAMLRKLLDGSAVPPTEGGRGDAG